MPSRSKSPRTGRELPETLRVGRVLRAHGICGEVKVEVESDVPGRFDRGSVLLMALPGQTARPRKIASCRLRAGLALVRFDGITERGHAEGLRGALLSVPIDDVPEAPQGAFYHHQLIDCLCVDEAAGELGTVSDLIEDGGGVLLVVKRSGKTLLVPFVEAYLREVDVALGRILLRLPEGLIEACESRS